MTATKEKGYILKWNWYDGLNIHTEKFKNLKQIRKRLDDISKDIKYHIIWYSITKQVESGTYTDVTFKVWQKSKHIHNRPERKI